MDSHTPSSSAQHRQAAGRYCSHYWRRQSSCSRAATRTDIARQRRPGSSKRCRVSRRTPRWRCRIRWRALSGREQSGCRPPAVRPVLQHHHDDVPHCRPHHWYLTAQCARARRRRPDHRGHRHSRQHRHDQRHRPKQSHRRFRPARCRPRRAQPGHVHQRHPKRQCDTRTGGCCPASTGLPTSPSQPRPAADTPPSLPSPIMSGVPSDPYAKCDAEADPRSRDPARQRQHGAFRLQLQPAVRAGVTATLLVSGAEPSVDRASACRTPPACEDETERHNAS